MVELSQRLKDGRQYALGVLTGNARAVAHVKLRAAGILEFFEFGAFGDSARERGHLVEVAWREAQARYGTKFNPEQTLLLGDTPRDIEAARANQARVIGVATGRFSVEDLQEHAPDAVFADLSDVEAVLSTIETLTQ